MIDQVTALPSGTDETAYDRLERFATERRLAPAFQTKLFESSPEVAKVLAVWIERLSPSGNALQELYSLSEEIAARERSPFLAVLRENEIERLFEAPHNRKELYRLLRRYLENRRYPEISKIERQLQELRAALVSETGLKFELPEDLEGDSLALHLSIRGGEDLREIAEKLNRAAASPKLRALLSLLQGGEVVGEGASAGLES